MIAVQQAEIHRLRAPVSDSDWSRGPAYSAVTLLEYGDYECADCRAAYPVIEKVFAQNRSRMRMVFRHFPFESLHPHAMQAALAAEAAGRQGKFWQMPARPFEADGRLLAQNLPRYAYQSGLEMERFRADMSDAESAKKIRQGKLLAGRSGLGRVPTIFLNDVRYDGPADHDALSAAMSDLFKD